jgi:hypothetical protein
MTNQLNDQYYVVDFMHIDDYRCFCPLKDAILDDFLSPLSPAEKHQHEEQLRQQLSELFRNAGWEGDGTIGCLFVPPCFSSQSEGDTWCTTIYHVKQSNNGTSWLAIPKGFQFVLPEGALARKG